MNSLAKPSRVIRAVASEEEITVIGGVVQRVSLPGVGPMATANQIIAAAEAHSVAILEAARAQAEAMLAEAQEATARIADEAHAAGYQAGLADAAAQGEQLLGLLQTAASQGAGIRDEVAAQAMPVITRAVLVAIRRLVGEYYADDPSRTAAACADAVRSASGQEIVSIRVNPAVEAQVTAELVDLAAYIRPDDSVEIGGCIVDLRNGTIDAALDTRMSLMEMAITSAAGEVQG